MRSVLLYLFLVGVPVLAVSAVLRAGQRLRAPLFVEGTWRVERGSSTSAESPCADALINADRTLTISQSGSHLLLTLNDETGTTLAGEIRDATITAGTDLLPSQSPVDGRGARVSIQVHATVERGSDADRLQGFLSSYACPTSTPVAFSARRVGDGPPRGR